jgi:taurine dioxygenase
VSTTTTLRITPETAALGAVVDGINLHEPLTPALTADLRAALANYEVLFFPDANLTPEEQIRFGREFGALQTHPSLDALPDHPEVVVFDTAEQAPVAEMWHTDVTCAPQPPMGSILQLVIVPDHGGNTHWSSMSAAYDALDDGMKARIDGLRALHVSWWKPRQESVHPVVRTHPESGRKGLFVNGLFTKQIVDMDPDESRELLAFLCEHATRDEFTVEHRWQPGDIAFWDNRITQHRVDNDFGDARRRGHRVAIDGDTPR